MGLGVVFGTAVCFVGDSGIAGTSSFGRVYPGHCSLMLCDSGWSWFGGGE